MGSNAATLQLAWQMNQSNLRLPIMATNPNATSLLDPETINSPYSYYEWMRAQDPVHFDARAGAWLITKYDDIAQAVRMEELSSELGLSKAHREEWQDE